jgi:type III secretory pathway component EscR
MEILIFLFLLCLIALFFALVTEFILVGIVAFFIFKAIAWIMDLPPYFAVPAGIALIAFVLAVFLPGDVKKTVE